MALPKIYEQIYAYAKNYIVANSSYSPKVLKDIPQNENIFPLVIIKEELDRIFDENLDKSDQKYKVGYEIEIYTVDKENTAKQVIANELIGLVNDVFDEHYGFNRKANQNIPNADLNVNRQHMRYEGILDNNIIYRR